MPVTIRGDTGPLGNWYAGKEEKVNKTIQSKLMGKIIHTSSIYFNLNTHCFSLIFVCLCVLHMCLCGHICMKSRALFWFMWCGMSGMSRCIRERWGGHCLPSRSDEAASTIDPSTPPILGTYQLEGLCFPRGLGVKLPEKNWSAAMREKLLFESWRRLREEVVLFWRQWWCEMLSVAAYCLYTDAH